VKPYERGNKFYKRGKWYWAYVDGRRISLKVRSQAEAQKEFDRLTGGENIRQKPLVFEDAVTEYKDSVKFKKLAPTTQFRHSWSFDKFLTPHFKNFTIAKIRPLNVREYIETREKSGAAANTILKEITALSAVFTWHVEHGKLTYNAVKQVGSKPSKRDLVRPNYTPSEDEINKVLKHLHKSVVTFFLALCNTGARVNELRTANVADFDQDLGTIRIIRKGGREDVLVLNDLVKNRIMDDLCLRMSRGQTRRLQPDSPLFMNRYGTRLLSIKRAIKFACERAEVHHLTHHSLRHGYATILYEQGYEIPVVANLLGNSIQVCTDIYVKWRNRKQKDLARNVQIGEI